MKRKLDRRISNLLRFALCLIMIVGIMPETALAAEKPFVPAEVEEPAPADYEAFAKELENAPDSGTQPLPDTEIASIKEQLGNRLNSMESLVPTYPYELDITETEVNNTYATADIIDNYYAGEPMYNLFGKMNDDYDVDVFQFTVTGTGNLNMLGRWIGNYIGYSWEDDMFIGLYDSSQTLVKSAGYYPHPDGYMVRAMSVDLSPGTYYIVVLADDAYGDLYVGEDYCIYFDYWQDSDVPAVNYQSHVENIGWQAFRSNGGMSGTSGQSLRLEAMKIILQGLDGGIEYRTHVQNIGWMDWVSNSELSGTSGKGLRLEAIEIRLTGATATAYDVYYRVHAQNFGWLGWAKNGESSGTAGFAYRLEAIEIKLVPKGGAAPGPTARAFVQLPTVAYQSHVQKVGWQGWVSNGISSGTSGQSLRLEAMRISLGNADGGVEYRTHVQNIGWMNWVNNGALSGTSGLSYRLEAINIRLTGNAANQYDIYYRVHAQRFGWMGWAKNGEASGTAGFAYRLEAIQIQLVPKGGAAPGSTAGAFIQK